MTAREIGAHQCGYRAAETWMTLRGPVPTDVEIIRTLASEDFAIYASLDSHTWWYWFNEGWGERLIEKVAE